MHYIYMCVYTVIYVHSIHVYTQQIYITVYIHTYTHTYIYIHTTSFLSSVDGHSGYFHILTVVNNDALNTEVNVFFQISVLFGFVLAYIARSGIAGSYGSFPLHGSQPCHGKGVCITQ